MTKLMALVAESAALQGSYCASDYNLSNISLSRVT